MDVGNILQAAKRSAEGQENSQPAHKTRVTTPSTGSGGSSSPQGDLLQKLLRCNLYKGQDMRDLLDSKCIVIIIMDDEVQRKVRALVDSYMTEKRKHKGQFKSDKVVFPLIFDSLV